MMLFFQQRPAWVRHVAIIFSLAILGLGIGAAVAANNKRQNVTPTATVNPTSSDHTLDLPDGQVKTSPTAASSAFHWGVTLRPEPFREAASNEAFLVDQFKAMKSLGITTVRTDYNTKNESMNNKVIALAKENDMEVVFIIPFGPNDVFTDKKLSTNAYNYVLNIVKKHKGEVKIWQLGTEVASVALKSGGYHGVDAVDYPEDKYKAVSTWLLSATKAVKDADPDAKRMLNDQWVHVGFFDRLIKDGANFEILGWNWFSDMGDNMDKAVLDSKTNQTYNLMAKLKSYNKEIWISEVNRRNGDADGNSKAQADYIAKLGNYAAKNSSIKGFLVFHLLGEEGYGLISFDPVLKTIAGYKPAFTTYQSLIKANKK